MVKRLRRLHDPLSEAPSPDERPVLRWSSAACGIRLSDEWSVPNTFRARDRDLREQVIECARELLLGRGIRRI
jgi:hypothetical protein